MTNKSFTDNVDELAEMLTHKRPLFVLTGAGCSTASGIPDYRDKEGNWKHQQPVQFQAFCEQEHTRKRYWARSMLGWPRVSEAAPNPVHFALAKLEGANLIQHLITQNVDGLHQKAGSEKVIDLHGNLETVTCLSCKEQLTRQTVQQWLIDNNASIDHETPEIAPDGDVSLENINFDAFNVMSCPRCSGILKPDVVFFGESVPRSRVQQAMAELKSANAVLIIGSSLMVFSGYRFCREATATGKAIYAVNLGTTRADNELTLKLNFDCGEVLSTLIERMRL